MHQRCAVNLNNIIMTTMEICSSTAFNSEEDFSNQFYLKNSEDIFDLYKNINVRKTEIKWNAICSDVISYIFTFIHRIDLLLDEYKEVLYTNLYTSIELSIFNKQINKHFKDVNEIVKEYIEFQSNINEYSYGHIFKQINHILSKIYPYNLENTVMDAFIIDYDTEKNEVPDYLIVIYNVSVL